MMRKNQNAITMVHHLPVYAFALFWLTVFGVCVCVCVCVCVLGESCPKVGEFDCARVLGDEEVGRFYLRTCARASVMHIEMLQADRQAGRQGRQDKAGRRVRAGRRTGSQTGMQDELDRERQAGLGRQAD
jgi:hypothetical protein